MHHWVELELGWYDPELAMLKYTLASLMDRGSGSLRGHDVENSEVVDLDDIVRLHNYRRVEVQS